MQMLAAQSVTLAGRGPFRRALALAALLLIFGLLAAPAYADRGSKYFNEGRKAEARGDSDAALVSYEKALDAVPESMQYKSAARRMRFQAAMMHVDRGHKLRNAGKLEEALKEFERAFAIDPSSDIAEQELRRTLAMIEAKSAGQKEAAQGLTPRQQAEAETLRKLEQVEGPIELTPPSRAPITLHATNDSKMLFETIGKLAGINVLFDQDYQGRRVTIDLNQVTLEQALDNLAAITKALWKPLTGNTILVYPDTKRRDQEPQVIKTFYLSNTIQPNELTELAQVIRNLLDAQKVQQVNSQNAIIIRDTPDKIAIVEKLVNDIDKAKPEVIVDVAVLQVTRDFSRQLGIFPGSPGLAVGAAFTPGGLTTTTTTPSTNASGTTTTTTTTGTTSSTTSGVTLGRLAHLSTHDWSVVLPGGALNALLSDSKARLLQNPQVRASDGSTARLRIGSRVPVATGSFQPGIGGVGINPLVNTQFQYLDVGVILEVTPRVHADREVYMKMHIEISAVTSHVNIGGIDQPIIGQRTVEEEIRLREGETNVIGGIMEEQKQNSISGIPGLSQIPLLKYLFSNTTSTVSEDEVIILMTPHVVRLPVITALNMRGIDVGTQTNIAVRTRAASAVPGPVPGGAAPGAETPPPGAVVPSVTPGAGAGQKPPSTPLPIPSTAPSTPPTGAKPGGLPGTGPTPAAPAPPPAPATQPTPPAGAAAPAPDSTPAAAPSLRFDSAIYSQPMGSTFPVNIRIDNAQNVFSVPFQLFYDAKILKIVNILNGDFLGRDGQAVAVVQRVDDQNGVATITLTRPPGTAGISGSGVLATVSFQATAGGQSSLNILRSAARDASQQPVSVGGAQTRVIIR
jgi:general secretion pathway protein D